MITPAALIDSNSLQARCQPAFDSAISKNASGSNPGRRAARTEGPASDPIRRRARSTPVDRARRVVPYGRAFGLSGVFTAA
ncbi:hypothetical protein GA0070612_1628 [Micromonospora chokoriensis]|uniref:Uncharacterized protein n=1 Tax=Micromonospora chokoriensis TaxID=356851 RepID=A0A1C4VNB8_9ACTN|nr:hypothetical protein GA0070612_1628 [Micromonospora chokoriensis]